MSYVAIAGVVISAGTAAYSASQQKKAAATAQSGMADLSKKGKLGDPELIDWQNASKMATGSNLNNLGQIQQLGRATNRFNRNQAMAGYQKFQPYFKQNQELIGRNNASFARGELPSDVVGSIGRAAAQRGIQGGFGMSQGAGGGGTALGNLNLRNLGLASLDLSKWGTQQAQASNNSAVQMTPGLFDATSQYMTPALAMNGMQFNAAAQNRVAEENAGFQNALGLGMINNQQQSSMQQAQAVQGAGNTVAGLMSTYAQTQQQNNQMQNQQQSYIPSGGNVNGYRYNEATGYAPMITY